MKFAKKLPKFLPKILSLLLGLSLVLAPNVKAIELIVSENGSGSESVTTVESSQTTTVTQTSDAQISNDISVDSNTGNNEASGNTGQDTTITTGDATTNVNIENNLNFSIVAQEECCLGAINAEITSNGTDSENAIIIENTNSTTVTVNQNATIENYISGTLNTGGNIASNNSGNVYIETGNINVAGSIINGPVNTSLVNIGSGGRSNVGALISGNGSGSQNLISAAFYSPLNVNVFQRVNFSNSVDWDLNTGRNSANDNSGDVSIKTGEIDFEFLIKNIANIGGVEITTCCEIDMDPEEEPDKPDVGGTPPSEDGDDKDNDGDSSGQITSEAASTSAGGLGIIGLSDTSSEAAQTLFFWIALAMIAFGGKIATDELISTSRKKR